MAQYHLRTMRTANSQGKWRFAWPNVVITCVSILIVWLGTIAWPLPPNGELDPSWQQILVDAWLNDRQFGADVVFTWGPLGFLFSQFTLPDALQAKLAFEVAGRAMLAVLLVAIAAQATLPRRIAWVLAMLLFGSQFDPVVLALTAALLGLWLVPPGSGIRSAAAIVVIGFLALVKFTIATFAGFGGVLAVGAAVWQRRPGRAGVIAAGLVSSVLGWWILAGQSLANLPQYAVLGSRLSAGYASAMALEETPSVFVAGLVVIACHALWLAAAAPTLRSQPWRLPIVALLGLAVAIAWKQGFTRADAHVLGFFGTSLMLGLLLPSFLGPSKMIAGSSWVLVVACVAALAATYPQWLHTVVTGVPARLMTSARNLTDLAETSASYHRGAALSAAAGAFPATRSAVGSATIDMVGNAQGLLYLNRLQHWPRPIPQSYAAYTPALLEANSDFFKSAGAPQFVLATVQPIDGRYPSQEDASVLAELPGRYTAAFEERDLTLLRRRESPTPIDVQKLDLLIDVDVRPGELIPLPDGRNHALWMTVAGRQTLWARLRGLVYRPVPLHMTVVDDHGLNTEFRIVPGIAASGFLIQPRIVSSAQAAAWLRGEAMNWNTELMLGTGVGESAVWEGFTVTISRLHGVSLRITNPFEELVHKGILPVLPRVVESVHPWRVLVDPEPKLFIHAPGSVQMNIPAGARSISGTFGIEAGAYMGAGSTDGVEFVVDVTTAEGVTTTLWRRTLQPLSAPGDRGGQSFRVELPLPPPQTVTILTKPGAQNRTEWDWSYVGAVTFER
jgi:hypothetical protein